MMAQSMKHYRQHHTAFVTLRLIKNSICNKWSKGSNHEVLKIILSFVIHHCILKKCYSKELPENSMQNYSHQS